MRVRSLAFRTDLALLRLGGTVVTDHGDHLSVRTPANPTFHWGNFLLLPAVPADADIDRWLACLRSELPGAAHAAFGVDVTTGGADELAAFAARGMRVEVSAVLTAQRVREPRTRHATAVQRPLTSDDDWAQSLRLTRLISGVPDGEFDRLRTAGFRRLVEAGHGVWLGAFVAGRLAAQLGLVDAGGGVARFQNVETDPQLRRRGLAGGLVHAAGRHGTEVMGTSTLVVVADPDYVAIDLYRALGFAVTEAQLQTVLEPPA